MIILGTFILCLEKISLLSYKNLKNNGIILKINGENIFVFHSLSKVFCILAPKIYIYNY